MSENTEVSTFPDLSASSLQPIFSAIFAGKFNIMAQKPGIPKGTRDFSPLEVARREYIMNVMKTNFRRFGFGPIETPSFENFETLMGKYGEEGDRLIFKILNSGNYLEKVNPDWLTSVDYKKLTPAISEKALRYDLTVPFARYVVQHRNDIDFPFKRYQIQPVWRADRPQSGRFREFYQCDADVVGSKSLWQEVELIQLYDTVLSQLGLSGCTIKINNRKVLAGIAETIGASEKLIDFTVALDKLDKIGADGVRKEWLEKGISPEAIAKLEPLFTFSGTLEKKLDTLSQLLAGSGQGMAGIEELRFICTQVMSLGIEKSILDLDVTLARGLNYYTGAIMEVSAPEDVQMGSIGGGGRYDDLTGIFGLKDVSGVGISFGLDRIYMVLEALNLFPPTVEATSKTLFINFGTAESLYAMRAITLLRKAGIAAELYPDNAKTGKQIQYAEKKGIPYVVICGDREMAAGTYAVKNLTTGAQQEVAFERLKEIVGQ